jgi:hypothetical protein
VKYDPEIGSIEPAYFCHGFAACRYEASIIRDDEAVLAEDAEGLCHTDAVLRALSFFWSKRDWIGSPWGDEIIVRAQTVCERIG